MDSIEQRMSISEKRILSEVIKSHKPKKPKKFKGVEVWGLELEDTITKAPYARSQGGWNSLIIHLREHGYNIIKTD